MQADFLTAPVAGVDEAGRGPLAGPVVAAAVILDPERPIAGLCDSKKLAAGRREQLAAAIRERALAWSVAWCDRAEIDALNILAATMLAMRRAILGLAVTPRGVQVDGNRLPDLRFRDGMIDGVAIVGGDAKVEAISAALRTDWRPTHIPLYIARLLGKSGDLIERLFRTSMPINSSRVRKLSRPLTFSCEKAKQVFRYKPTETLTEGILKEVIWLKKKNNWK